MLGLELCQPMRLSPAAGGCRGRRVHVEEEHAGRIAAQHTDTHEEPLRAPGPPGQAVAVARPAPLLPWIGGGGRRPPSRVEAGRESRERIRILLDRRSLAARATTSTAWPVADRVAELETRHRIVILKWHAAPSAGLDHCADRLASSRLEHLRRWRDGRGHLGIEDQAWKAWPPTSLRGRQPSAPRVPSAVGGPTPTAPSCSARSPTSRRGVGLPSPSVLPPDRARGRIPSAAGISRPSLESSPFARGQ